MSYPPAELGLNGFDPVNPIRESMDNVQPGKKNAHIVHFDLDPQNGKVFYLCALGYNFGQ